MKTFTVISIFLLLGCTKGQFGGLWNGGAFNPWNNPNHPANRGIANGIAARNLFAWPAAPFIRTAPIPSVVADSPALNIDGVAEEHQDALNDALERKKAIDAKIREAAFGGGSVAASFRPGFVNDLLKERMQLVNEIRRTQQEAVRDRLALVAKRQEIAKQIAESTEPITFGLLMQSLNRAYGREMAAKSIAHQRKMMQKFDKPFLRPVVSVFAPNGLPSGAVAETKIYQNFQEQKGTLLKDEDIFVVTKLSGFSGDKLHLGVDLHAVNETLSDAQALSEDFLETELEFQDEMLESQMTLSQRWLDLQLGDPEEQTKFQEKIMKKQLSRAEKLMEIKGKLAERQRELEEKMAEKQQDLIEKELKRQQKLMKKQQKQFEKELKKQQKQLEKQAKAEAKALERQMDLAGKFSDSGFIQQQLDFAKQQALLNIPSKRQQKIEEGLEFLRNKIHSLTGGDDALLQKQLRAAEKLEEKQRELEKKRLEKQRELLEKQAEKERDLLKKQLEKEHDLREKLLEQEAKAAEKLNDKLEKERELAQKEVERQQDLAEKEAELFEKLREKETEKAQKELEKEADAVQKKLEKEQKLAEKERERIQKELEKEQDKLEKEQEKAQKLLEKELEKAEKQLEKEHEKAIKQMEKEQKSAEKQLEKELKQREKENDLLEKRLEKEQELHLDSIPISDTIPQNPFVHLPFNQYIPRFGPPNGFRF